MSSSSALAQAVPAIPGACRRSPQSGPGRRWADLFRIDGYSTINAMVPPSTSISSGTFRAGGHKWELHYFPNGVSTFSILQPAVSVSLTLEDGGLSSDAMAGFKVSILNRAGVPAYGAAVKPCLYTSVESYYWRSDEGRCAELVSTEEFRRSAPKVIDDEDCHNVHCEVCVLKLDSESETMWYIRQALGKFS
ncbi:hypothetical protein QOZ80_9BG0714970 [Eleusine coracana subsp. coracana]|nr:hypothetical protein QOZ80_9BG0714970 [Eleusine coracana subsp. coracana]